MTKPYQVCKCCGQKIRAKVHCYSSGNGCLSLSWRVGKETSSQQVTEAQAKRFLALKENEHLSDRNWLPVCINDRWVLARHVKRIGPNALRISGHTFFYEVDKTDWDTVEECNLKTTFVERVKGKKVEVEMKNLSLRMVVRFFLNHEEELRPFFRHYKAVSGDL